MTLFRKTTAASLRARRADLQAGLQQDKVLLKSAQQQRSNPEQSSDDLDRVNAEVRHVDDTIKAKTSQLIEINKQILIAEVHEGKEKQGDLWAALQKELLEIDRHARNAAACFGRAKTMENELRSIAQTFQRGGCPEDALSRPLKLAVRARRDQLDATSDRAESSALDEFLQSQEFPVGEKYPDSAVARMFDVLRSLNATDGRPRLQNQERIANTTAVGGGKLAPGRQRGAL